MACESVLTPYYMQDTIYTKEHIYKNNEDGVSTLFYLQKIYPGQYLQLHTVKYPSYLDLYLHLKCYFIITIIIR